MIKRTIVIKIGMYRIGDTGTTTFSYNNIVLKNKR